ncbi:hypothetical protein CkaCkLH20_05660 [Colletotrichum karsti]|uniref:Uncharacterized protein n=1 Tax=Colletotrichum karsti TaxID=1095194 RepID=A0A9P6I5W4_9PEZI|nr:uncharacterized protein CkaCkLH20_05660 [Colletotrichum karsti]KAF9876814.1 hypothetical protein CkaCkLH20_05660 [Colletotrichum karsti]
MRPPTQPGEAMVQCNGHDWVPRSSVQETDSGLLPIHRKFGFVIYRTAYGGKLDELWHRYMHHLKTAVEQTFVEDLPAWLREINDLEWTVMEDRTRLSKRTKDEVRMIFHEWCESASDERDGDGAFWAARFVIPRYSHCLYVDEQCLKSFERYENEEVKGLRPNTVYVSLIARPNRGNDEDEEDNDEDEDEEDEDRFWMNLSCYYVVEMYNFMGSTGIMPDWQYAYKRPPGVWAGWGT